MTLPLTCPACQEPLPVPTGATAAPVRCPKCQAVLTASAPSVDTARRRGPLLLGSLALVVGGGLAAYFLVSWARPVEFAHPKDVFTARFPNTPKTTSISTANPAMLKWGEEVTQTSSGGREYAVTVLDGLNAGDQETGPATRDAQLQSVLRQTAMNTNGDILTERPVTHGGHAGREAVIVDRGDGRLTAVRLVVGEKAALRMTVAGSGNRARPDAFLDSAAAFFGTVHTGSAFGPPILEEPPAVSATDLGAAYRADPKTADAKYKDRWVRVTGTVTTVAGDGQSFEMDAAGGTVAVQRATRGLLSVRLRQGTGPVTVTGKCGGMAEPTAGAGPRIVLTDATVGKPAKADDAK